jgi:hypothetical protein
MSRTLRLFVLAIVGSGSVPMVAATLSYEFDFFFPGSSLQQQFFYKSEGPTAPGTVLAGVELMPVSGNLLVASRDFTGAWLFGVGFSGRFAGTWTTSTDLTFPNSPGAYAGLPALFSTIGIGTGQTPETVDITIQSVPEPGIALSVLTALVGFAGLARATWQHRA